MAARIETKQVTATTTAAALVSAAGDRTTLYIVNEDTSDTVRIGPSDVDKDGGTAANIGFALAPGKDVTIATGLPDAPDAVHAFYVIADTNTAKVSVMEFYRR